MPHPNASPNASTIWAIHGAHASGLEGGACLGVKNIGKPCAGKPHARFDEGGQVKPPMARLLRHRHLSGAETDRSGLKADEPVLYSTRDPGMSAQHAFLMFQASEYPAGMTNKECKTSAPHSPPCCVTSWHVAPCEFADWKDVLAA